MWSKRSELGVAGRGGSLVTGVLGQHRELEGCWGVPCNAAPASSPWNHMGTGAGCLVAVLLCFGNTVTFYLNPTHFTCVC